MRLAEDGSTIFETGDFFYITEDIGEELTFASARALVAGARNAGFPDDARLVTGSDNGRLRVGVVVR